MRVGGIENKQLCSLDEIYVRVLVTMRGIAVLRVRGVNDTYVTGIDPVTVGISRVIQLEKGYSSVANFDNVSGGMLLEGYVG